MAVSFEPSYLLETSDITEARTDNCVRVPLHCELGVSMTPRSRTVSTGVLTSLFAPIFLRLARDPNHTSSVFDGLSCSRLAAH